MTGANSYRPEQERFWKRVQESPSGCWLWTGGLTEHGYGVFNLSRKNGAPGGTVKAHRWAYEHLIAEIPEGLPLDHLCRTRNCVNPYHLDPVSHAVNLLRARKQLCLRGHDMSDASVRKSGRRCLKCHAQRERERYARGAKPAGGGR